MAKAFSLRADAAEELRPAGRNSREQEKEADICRKGEGMRKRRGRSVLASILAASMVFACSGGSMAGAQEPEENGGESYLTETQIIGPEADAPVESGPAEYEEAFFEEEDIYKEDPAEDADVSDEGSEDETTFFADEAEDFPEDLIVLIDDDVPDDVADIADDFEDTAGEITDLADEAADFPEAEEAVTEAAEAQSMEESAEAELFEEIDETEEAEEEYDPKAVPTSSLDLNAFISVSENGVLLSDNKIGVADSSKNLVLHFDLDSAKAAFPEELGGFTPANNTDAKYRWLNYESGTLKSFSYIDLQGHRTINASSLSNYIAKYTVCISIQTDTADYRSEKYSLVSVPLEGKCGADAYWKFTPATKELAITGTGGMYSYAGPNTPWFQMKDSIKTVTVADGITSLGNACFYTLSNLERVTIPDTVTSIGTSCFMSCDKLAKVEGGDGVKSIAAGAFNNCTALKTLSFPQIQKIEYWAFRGCTGLEHLYLMSADLNEITLNETNDPKYQGPFQWDKKPMTVHVYAGSRVSGYFREDTWKIQSEDPPQISINLETAGVTGITDQTYTGAVITQNPVIKDNSYTLVEGKDYKITYAANTAAGSAAMTIEGTGDYTGTITETFKIAAADLKTAAVDNLDDQVYTGSAIMPAPVVKLGAVTLKADTDYTVDYKDNVTVGTATITITGKGSCTGTVTKTFKIVPADLSAAVVEGLEDQTYTGSAVTPAPVVKLGEVTLTADTDYTVEYKDNTNAGTAAVTIRGTGNYTGTLEKNFQIKKPEKEPSPVPADSASKENPQEAAAVEKTITGMKSDKDAAGSSYSLLQLKATAKKTSVTLSWQKVSGAKQYVIYGNKCGKKNRYERIAAVKGKKLKLKKLNGKKLQTGTYYKFLVTAVKGDQVLAISKTVHVATKGGTVSNAYGIKLDQKKLRLKLKKKATITATVRTGSLRVKNHRKVMFESSDIRVATVTGKGKIKAVGKGTCYVYAYAQNGKSAKVKVTVK